MIRIRIRIRVRGSPYSAVQYGRKAWVVGRERMSTTTEVLRIKFDDGGLHELYPDEVERLDGSPL